MIGGFAKTTSRLAIAAAAGLFVGGLTLGPAQAADLGGDCCADLEERVAELEATTVRKGNRKVSVKLSGHVNRMLLWWDDGINDDVYSVDNGESESRFRLSGGASIMPGLSAGFLMEVGVISADSEDVNQRVDGFETENSDGFLSARKVSFNLKHDQLGKLTVGRDSPATDDIIHLNLSQNPIADASPEWTENFRLVARRNTGINNATLGCNGASCVTGLRHSDFAPDLDTRRGDIVRYDSPSLFGLVISAAWGEDDLADIAIRYKKEWNSIRLVAGIGYLWDTDETETYLLETSVDSSIPESARLGLTSVINCPPPGLGQATCVDERFDFEELKGSASMMHVPTGLYLYGAFDIQTPGRSIASSLRANTFTAPVTNEDAEDATMWYLQAGIKRRLLAPSLGSTTLYGEYQQFDDFGVRLDGAPITGFAQGDLANKPSGSEITDTSTDIWGVGIVQDIDVAAMKLYAAYRHYDFNARVTSADVTPGNKAGQSIPLEDFHAVAFGGRINF
jgi:predicted porin